MQLPPELLGPLGLTVALGIGLLGLWREHIRSDRLMETDRDHWRQLALTGTEIAERATTIATRRRDA